jgi:hypothetical protein
MTQLSRADFLKKDARSKCGACRLWMRHSPTRTTPQTRRRAPHADRCTDCPPSASSVRGCQGRGGCDQCRLLRVRDGRLEAT